MTKTLADIITRDNFFKGFTKGVIEKINDDLINDIQGKLSLIRMQGNLLAASTQDDSIGTFDSKEDIELFGLLLADQVTEIETLLQAKETVEMILQKEMKKGGENAHSKK